MDNKQLKQFIEQEKTKLVASIMQLRQDLNNLQNMADGQLKSSLYEGYFKEMEYAEEQLNSFNKLNNFINGY